MKMADLVSYGYPQRLIRIWEQEKIEELLPIQAKAVQDYNVLDSTSENLIVIAPTSSGKTFIGELAAVKEALEMKRTLFLVPFRAIAEELYANFLNKYGRYGLRIVISDRDHREYDEDIINGEFEIAVIVYEKLAGLLVIKPGLFSGCGLIIADEVQMMMDKERGPIIELLVTKLLLFGKRVRIIALSAVLDKLSGFDRWLNAQVLMDKHRPVELREGVYTPDGQVKYREFNSKKRGIEKLDPWSEASQGLLNLVQSFIDRDEQVLIFCSTRPSTRDTAHMLAETLSRTSPAIDTIRRGNDLTDSATREEIQNLLQHSVAYHNSDLALDERMLIEEGFRKREIKAIACTSTLAMGVNVPARNVIVYEPQKWTGERFVPIAVGEYKNMVGRAGRYSAGDPYGCSYLIAPSEAKADAYDSTYIRGTLEGFASRFGEQAIDSQVLEIIAAGLATTADEIRRFVFATYNGQNKWTTDKSKEAINHIISTAIERCLEHKAIEADESGDLSVTVSGRLCAAGGYSLDHLSSARYYLATYKNDVDISIIYWALETDVESDLMRAYHIGKMQTHEFKCGRYQQALAELKRNEAVGPLLDDLASYPAAIDYDECVILRRCLACNAWITETPIRRIEANFPGITAGAIRNTAEVCTWLISFLGELAKISEPKSDRYIQFRELAERLSYGSTKEALGLCRIRGTGLSRDERNHLVQEGIRTIDDVLANKPEDIPLSRRKALTLIRVVESSIEDSTEKRKRYQQTRLSSIGVDVSILTKLYEKDGKQLEIAIGDLLKPPFIELTCRQVTKQNEGEPDHLLHDGKGNVFAIQTTAREKKMVSMKKATSVIGQSSKYKPSGYIVLARPDLETLAIKDSESQIATGRNYKLIPIYVMAEMLVLFHEGKLSSEDIEKILID
ncbi:MAG: DEAD/DEAH box helicase [Candidatus Hodarchaeota archaeon]